MGDQAIAAIYAGRAIGSAPRGGVRIEACGAPAMAKTHPCPATSTRFCLSERLGCVKFSDRVGGWVAPWAPGLIWVRDRRAGRSVA
jgi:hypothetical protein